MIGEHHQATAVDLIHAGSDGGELEAAQAEKEEEAVDDTNTTIDQYHVHCDHSVLLDDKGHVLNEYRTMVHCPFCEQEALMGCPDGKPGSFMHSQHMFDLNMILWHILVQEDTPINS